MKRKNLYVWRFDENMDDEPQIETRHTDTPSYASAIPFIHYGDCYANAKKYTKGVYKNSTAIIYKLVPVAKVGAKKGK